MSMPIAEWLNSLDQMEASLATALSELDHYERNWSQTLEEGTANDVSPSTPLTRLEERLGEWDSRLAAAADLTASVERELNDRQAAIGRWQEVFNGWRGSIEQPPAATS